MNDLDTFMAFLTLLMNNDGNRRVTTEEEHKKLCEWANTQALDFGYNGWIDMYHLWNQEDARNEPVQRRPR
jgi:hypothetical protein